MRTETNTQTHTLSKYLDVKRGQIEGDNFGAFAAEIGKVPVLGHDAQIEESHERGGQHPHVLGVPLPTPRPLGPHLRRGCEKRKKNRNEMKWEGGGVAQER